MTAKKRSKFDTKKFLSTIDGGRKVRAFSKKQVIFVQGDSSDAVFYLQKGKVRLTVVSKSGKQATLAILNAGDFFGEGLAGGDGVRWAVRAIERRSGRSVVYLPPAKPEG